MSCITVTAEVEVDLDEYLDRVDTDDLLRELESRNVGARIPMSSEMVQAMIENVRRATYARNQQKLNDAVGEYFWHTHGIVPVQL